MTTDEMVAGIKEYVEAKSAWLEVCYLPLADGYRSQESTRCSKAKEWLEDNASAIANELERLAAWAQQVMPLVEAAEELKEAEPGRMTPKWMSRYQDAVTKLIAAAIALNLEVPR